MVSQSQLCSDNSEMLVRRTEFGRRLCFRWINCKSCEYHRYTQKISICLRDENKSRNTAKRHTHHSCEQLATFVSREGAHIYVCLSAFDSCECSTNQLESINSKCHGLNRFALKLNATNDWQFWKRQHNDIWPYWCCKHCMMPFYLRRGTAIQYARNRRTRKRMSKMFEWKKVLCIGCVQLGFHTKCKVRIIMLSNYSYGEKKRHISNDRYKWVRMKLIAAKQSHILYSTFIYIRFNYHQLNCTQIRVCEVEILAIRLYNL